MPFKKIATLDIKNVFAANSEGKFEWRSFVKQANEEPGKDRSHFLPKEAYKYDTDNFLFLTARAISGMEKWGYNGNYDAFPWEEIKKASVTYPGAGFYIEHKEDSADDAKGIVLDVFLNEDEEYLVALCAIDKKEYPEFCEQILNGTYNQVSMSCLASTCECSYCHNVATSYDELCQHMNPNMPYSFMKGKLDENGETVYEINRDLNFTGLSAVAVPADKDAFVFDVKASKKKQNSLQEELNKYTLAKQASKMKELKTACEEQFDGMDTIELLQRLKNIADSLINESTASLGTTDTSVAPSTMMKKPIQDALESLIQSQVGIGLLNLKNLQHNKDNEVPTCKPCDDTVVDKELDAYLDSDNYSYTPFSSTAKKSNKLDLDPLINEYK